PGAAFRRPGLPSVEGRAGVLGEPAAAGGRGRAAAMGVRPGPGLQRRARREPAALRARGPATGAARDRRPARRLRGRRVLRGRAAPLDALVAPARAGHGVLPARAPGARPLLGEPHAAPRAPRRAHARAPGALVDLPRRD